MENRILLITEPLYEYSTMISKALEDHFGCRIDVLETYYSGISNRNDKSTILQRICDKFAKNDYFSENRRIQEDFFRSHSNISYTYILVILQNNLHKDLLEDFFRNNICAYKVLYLWDDVSRVENFSRIIKLFDKIASFDKRDCLENGLTFVPLFYVDDYIYKNEKKVYDFSFVGSLHSDRSIVLDKLLIEFPLSKYNWNASLVGTSERIFLDKVKRRKLFNSAIYYQNKSLTMKETSDIIKRSKVCIDLPVPGQVGLTMRTIECIAAETKIITTNDSVKEYDFYNSNNICLIDRENPFVPETFIRSKYHKISETIVNNYSIHRWVNKLLD